MCGNRRVLNVLAKAIDGVRTLIATLMTKVVRRSGRESPKRLSAAFVF
jgi:hypothetical protein